MPGFAKIMPNLIPPQGPLNPLVVVVAYNGLCTFEFAIAVEMFGLERPEMGDSWYRFAIAGIESGALKGTGGVRFLADGDAGLIEKAGTVIVPGWRGIDEPVPAHLSRALRNARDKGARILSICSGVMVLAAAGLLTGRRATTHWRYTELLAARYPEITVLPDVLYVDDGNVLTSAGGAAGIDLCLHLIRRDFGSKAANTVARRLVVPPHRDGGQAQYVERAVPVVRESARLGPLLDRMRADIKSAFSSAALAKLAGMSRRTFLRRFEAATGTTPAKWLLAERLAKVQDSLESTVLSIEEIARLSGFASVKTMRHHFHKRFSVTPTDYRRVFGSLHRSEASGQAVQGSKGISSALRPDGGEQG